MLAGLVARDAEVLASVVTLRLAPIEDTLLLDTDLPRDALLLERLLEVTSLRGVLGMRLYNESGGLTHAVPDSFIVNPYPAAALTAPGTESRTASEFSVGSPTRWFKNASATRDFPVLRIRLPLLLPVTRQSLGTAEFLLDGTSLAAQRHALDQRLLTQAGLLIGAAVVIGAGLQYWAWLRLRRHAQALAAEQHRLIRTNAELALAVKSSAIGTVTAHLMHDLKSALSGLEAFIKTGAAEPASLDAEDWHAATHATRDLRHLTSEIADILHSLKTGEGVDLDPSELMHALQARYATLTQAAKVSLVCSGTSDTAVDGRHSQLVLLILSNLLRNAIEATPPGGRVTLEVAHEASATRWRVYDTGSGIPPERQAQLFHPLRSSKTDGGGIGLAISAQIAAHLNATLKLASTGPDGSVFELRIPGAPSPSAAR